MMTLSPGSRRAAKSMNMAGFLGHKAGINTVVPAILETFRLL